MHDVSLTPTAVFAQAGPVVKTVLVLLLAASILTWVWIVEAVVAFMRLSAALRRSRDGDDATILATVSAAGAAAREASPRGASEADRRAKIVDAMTRVARDLILKAEGGLPNLAIVSSVAPFVGLFGTVWGIMTSFAGIAEARDTSLAVVAPGIAEALAATAWGLAAAIPASIGYNRIGALFNRTAIALDDFVQAEAERLTGAELERPSARSR
ncbi:MAG: MotA/TolQ/ExbB proton channel family protein [Rhodopseudomonas sp.]|uniref:MotA/TolQ/ExbB proton channel family protein n=1 Tax=Rhodopseudomonas sp. TaxID=1078 RepID=UPI0039E642F5